MTNRLEWMLITAVPEIAEYAQSAGVHRIFVDMEVMGKAERQGHLDTHKAAHTFDDVSAIREVLTTSELMVRVNPLHAGTRTEVEESVARGADRLMLPMFTSRREVADFRALVPTGTAITFLAETPAALVRTADWSKHLHPGDEVHFGLNDLSLAMQLDFLFEPMGADLFRGVATHLNESGIPFGIGGIARPQGGELPARAVLGEHVRLGSSRAILSRAFHGSARTLEELVTDLDLPTELNLLRSVEESWRASTTEQLRDNHHFLAERSFAIASSRRHGG